MTTPPIAPRDPLEFLEGRNDRGYVGAHGLGKYALNCLLRCLLCDIESDTERYKRTFGKYRGKISLNVFKTSGTGISSMTFRNL